jgi:hypothetical protein
VSEVQGLALLVVRELALEVQMQEAEAFQAAVFVVQVPALQLEP